MKTMSIVLLLFSFIILGCGMMPTPNTQSVQYRVSFIGTWSAATHPSFPSAPTTGDPTMNPPSEPHFTTIIGAMHNDSFTLWESGSMASPGMERVAETGQIAQLQQEVLNPARTAGTVQTVIEIPGGVFDLPNTTDSENFTVNRSHPLLSLATMIAPSPDWFTGRSNVSLLNSDGEWIDNMILDLFPYNAGTEGPIDTSIGHTTDCPMDMPQCTNNMNLTGADRLNIQRINRTEGFPANHPLITTNGADSNGDTRVGYLVITRVR